MLADGNSQPVNISFSVPIRLTPFYTITFKYTHTHHILDNNGKIQNR